MTSAGMVLSNTTLDFDSDAANLLQAEGNDPSGCSDPARGDSWWDGIVSFFRGLLGIGSRLWPSEGKAQAPTDHLLTKKLRKPAGKRYRRPPGKGSCGAARRSMSSAQPAQSAPPKHFRQVSRNAQEACHDQGQQELPPSEAEGDGRKQLHVTPADALVAEEGVHADGEGDEGPQDGQGAGQRRHKDVPSRLA